MKGFAVACCEQPYAQEESCLDGEVATNIRHPWTGVEYSKDVWQGFFGIDTDAWSFRAQFVPIIFVTAFTPTAVAMYV